MAIMLDEIASYWLMPVEFYQASDKDLSIYSRHGLCLAYFKKSMLEWVAIQVNYEHMPVGFFESIAKTMQHLNRSDTKC